VAAPIAIQSLSFGSNEINQTTLDSALRESQAGQEFTGGFADRTTGQSGATDLGTNVQYTQAMVTDRRWYRFGFSQAQQVANDVPYWTDPTPAPAAGVGLFGGSQMPFGVTSLYDFTDTSLSAEFSTLDQLGGVNGNGLNYTAATGSLDLTQCRIGDFLQCRFDFNIVPQVANTTVEVGLIWATRDSSDTVTFQFALTAQPIFFGTGTVGKSYLSRPIISAYFASNEDINARALPAVRADNPVLVQPLTVLTRISR